MRLQAKGALFFMLLGLAFACVALAQEERASSTGARRVTRQDPDPQQKPIRSQPLTRSEGLAILGAALGSGHHPSFASDCSHFVHGLFERAGFPYAYASSSDLYAGIDEFRRVASPQAGDLVVWPGHAGIVVNPLQHSFFSRLRSGPGVNTYDSPYWKQRGRPRFFRYVKAAPSGVLSRSIRSASWKPTTLANTQPHKPAADDPVPDVSSESSRGAGFSVKPSENQPVNTETPFVAVVNSVRPRSDQVVTAFLQACRDAEQRLQGRDLLNSVQSLVVFDHFEVKKVHITGNEGWVEVQIDELVFLTESKAGVHKRSKQQRWPLHRRDHTSWEVTPVQDIIYLPRHIGVRVLAHELAQLTEDSSDPDSRPEEKAELARLLDVLLEQ